ncbi:uncharacterized protein ALTATR162_LOCUS12042 [Alternaria atra]|uniref:Zn(2)-C6 fungal-type domain-containing protein n=1 Tax=Alternaria atra TaxID=119953 RepID=A0A8J2IPY9_9PLEO|nr:uncharacterized protein ALTATR162_LOCUS12042 [Alternaria atra]CAG5188837.1 unnamed protein product [Alternaria atra]
MSLRAESNACTACARSKRKCGRQIPSCARCADKGKSCIYPPSKKQTGHSHRPLLSNGSVLRGRDALSPEAATDTSTVDASLYSIDDFLWDVELPPIGSYLGAPPSQIQIPSVLKTDWFLAPETWTISRRSMSSDDVPIGTAAMKKYVTVLQSWLRSWVTTGSNPLIHSSLYNVNFPACVQVAYATLASYVHRTPANTDIVLQIVEDRSNDLLRENGAILDQTSAEKWIDIGGLDHDLWGQLTRLHALLVYQIIGLFDGDVRARHVAEGHMAIQDSWAGKLFSTAGAALSNEQDSSAHLVNCLPKLPTYLQQQWYLWILSESIRRTWLVAASLSPVFSALQQRWAACPGGVMYTNRSGLWNASSAAEWERQCLEKNVAFLQRFECARLFHYARPADVDKFGVAMLEMTFSEDLLENWRTRSGGL